MRSITFAGVFTLHPGCSSEAVPQLPISSSARARAHAHSAPVVRALETTSPASPPLSTGVPWGLTLRPWHRVDAIPPAGLTVSKRAYWHFLKERVQCRSNVVPAFVRGPDLADGANARLLVPGRGLQRRSNLRSTTLATTLRAAHDRRPSESAASYTKLLRGLLHSATRSPTSVA